MNSPSLLFREEQFYRELPPFTLLTVVGTLFGWFLIIWVAVMGRPLGNLSVPFWLSLAIGLPLGILLPLAYARLRMVTQVFADRIVVNNGMAAGFVSPLADITAVEIRDDNIMDDYNIRNVGMTRNTRTAYTVMSSIGVQLSIADGRQLLIGSKDPQALLAAILASKNVARPVVTTES